MSVSLSAVHICILDDAELTRSLCTKLRCSTADLVSVLHTDPPRSSGVIQRPSRTSLLGYPVEVMTQVLQYLDLKSLSRMDVAIANSALRPTFLTCLRSKDIVVNVDTKYYESTSYATNPHLMVFFDWMSSRRVNWGNLTIGNNLDDDPGMVNCYQFEKLIRLRCFDSIKNISLYYFKIRSNEFEIDCSQSFSLLTNLVLNSCASSIKGMNLCQGRDMPEPISLFGVRGDFGEEDDEVVFDFTPFYPRFTALERIELDSIYFIGGGDNEGEWEATAYLSSLLNKLQALKELHIVGAVIPDIRKLISRPLLTKLSLRCYSKVTEWAVNLEPLMKKLPNLKSFILNTVLQREDSTVFDNTLSFVLKKYRNLQELNLRINSSTFDIVHCIESIFRTLAESDHHLSNLSVDWNPDRPTFYGKNYTFKKIFTSYPNSYLTSINIHLNGYKYATEDNVISVTSNCFPNARKIILNEVNICSSK